MSREIAFTYQKPLQKLMQELNEIWDELAERDSIDGTQANHDLFFRDPTVKQIVRETVSILFGRSAAQSSMTSINASPLGQRQQHSSANDLFDSWYSFRIKQLDYMRSRIQVASDICASVRLENQQSSKPRQELAQKSPDMNGENIPEFTSLRMLLRLEGTERQTEQKTDEFAWLRSFDAKNFFHDNFAKRPAGKWLRATPSPDRQATEAEHTNENQELTPVRSKAPTPEGFWWSLGPGRPEHFIRYGPKYVHWSPRVEDLRRHNCSVRVPSIKFQSL